MATSNRSSKSKSQGTRRDKLKVKQPVTLTGYKLAQQSSDFIGRNYMRFVEDFPGGYVYALGNKVIAHGNDLEKVDAEAIQRAGEHACGLVLVCVPETIEDACMIL